MNQRDLRTFEVDHERACGLAARIPPEVTAVAESGIRDGADAKRLADAGYDAILVGETLLRAGDRAGILRTPDGLPGGATVSDELLVKICGITSEADALLAVSLGARAVGFMFAPSPRQISVQLAGDIVKRLPTEIVTVGVFRDEAPQRVVEAVQTAGLGAAQLHGHESAQETQWVRARVPLVIKAFPAGDPTIARFDEFGADFLMVDGENPGSGQVFDWRLAEGVVDHHRLVLGRWAAPRQRGRRRRPPPPGLGRRLDRRRVVAGSEGPRANSRLRGRGPPRRRRGPGAPRGRRSGHGGRARGGEPYDWRDG